MKKMKNKVGFFSLSLYMLISCNNSQSQQSRAQDSITKIQETIEEIRKDESMIDTSAYTLETRFNTPLDYYRISVDDNSFAFWLHNLPLKPHGAEVKYYDGSVKLNLGIYEAVVDKQIGTKDLHQCADAVMRLRAEYLWSQRRYDEIHFNFTNGFCVDYSEWMKGKRIVVKGNKAFWVGGKKSPSNTYKDLWAYLELVFSYAGTLSLEKELNSVDIKDMQTGDVFIVGGSPGHAVIVVDMAIDLDTKDKVFLLAQSYMPAQEIHILSNPNNSYASPWYSLDFGETLHTPQWVFGNGDLRRFGE